MQAIQRFLIVSLAAGTLALPACGDDANEGDAGTDTDTDADTDTDTDTDADTDTDSDTDTDDCAADAGLTDSLGTTPECAGCLLESCCPQLLANASAPTYDTYISLMICGNSAACNDVCAADACGIGWAVNLDCGACVDESCCTEMDACFAVTECGACTGGSYDQETCCAISEFSAWAGCIDTSCALECAPCVDCQC
jgi:hypothetical protein